MLTGGFQLIENYNYKDGLQVIKYIVVILNGFHLCGSKLDNAEEAATAEASTVGREEKQESSGLSCFERWEQSRIFLLFGAMVFSKKKGQVRLEPALRVLFVGPSSNFSLSIDCELGNNCFARTT